MTTKLKYFCAILISLGVFTTATTQAGWRDLLDKAQKTVFGDATQSSTESVVTALSNEDVVAGLKEPLIQGAQLAISSLGQEGGFLGNPAVKTPVPGKLKTVEKGLHAIAQGQLADDFVESRNRAAEQATKSLFQLIAAKEKRIRENPIARTTDLLKRMLSSPIR